MPLHNAKDRPYRTGSKNVTCNVWSDAAREAAAEARREKGTKIGTVSVPPSEEEEGRRMDGAIQLRNQGALARHVGKALADNPHPEGSYQHVQWRIGYQKGHLS